MTGRLPAEFAERRLAEIESGLEVVGEGGVTVLATGYRLDVDALFPGRDPLHVDLSGGRIGAAGRDLHLPTDAGAVEVLSRYVELVRSLRGHDERWPTDTHELRTADIVDLARALDMTGDAVESLLATITAPQVASIGASQQADVA